MSAADMATFWAYALWTFGIKATWDSLPGPWWARVLLVAVCLAIPGPQDELLLIAITAACRRIRAARANTIQEN
jgi:hypothetical protein